MDNSVKKCYLPNRIIHIPQKSIIHEQKPIEHKTQHKLIVHHKKVEQKPAEHKPMHTRKTITHINKHDEKLAHIKSHKHHNKEIVHHPLVHNQHKENEFKEHVKQFNEMLDSKTKDFKKELAKNIVEKIKEKNKIEFKHPQKTKKVQAEPSTAGHRESETHKDEFKTHINEFDELLKIKKQQAQKKFAVKEQNDIDLNEFELKLTEKIKKALQKSSFTH